MNIPQNFSNIKKARIRLKSINLSETNKIINFKIIKDIIQNKIGIKSKILTKKEMKALLEREETI